MIAHSLAVLKNQRFGGRVNPERAALLGMFHDAAEIITGDLPTPVKYFNSEIRAAYQEVENMAKDRLLSMLPEDLRPVDVYKRQPRNLSTLSRDWIRMWKSTS